MNILSLVYLGNVRWFSKVCFGESVIDLHEHYVKQSYRNRCEIFGAGGRMALSVNVAKNRGAMRDVRIDYSKRWQHQHRQALVSAYAGAPYFDHYWPELESLYSRRFEFLADLNVVAAEILLRLLGSDARLRFSESYIEPAGVIADGFADRLTNKFTAGFANRFTNEITDRFANEFTDEFADGIAGRSIDKFTDLRDAISPKPRLARPDPQFRPVPYWQVFGNGVFEPDLSVVDLLFCEGPRALGVIRDSVIDNGQLTITTGENSLSQGGAA